MYDKAFNEAYELEGSVADPGCFRDPGLIKIKEQQKGGGGFVVLKCF